MNMNKNKFKVWGVREKRWMSEDFLINSEGVLFYKFPNNKWEAIDENCRDKYLVYFSVGEADKDGTEIFALNFLNKIALDL